MTIFCNQLLTLALLVLLPIGAMAQQTAEKDPGYCPTEFKFDHGVLDVATGKYSYHTIERDPKDSLYMWVIRTRLGEADRANKELQTNIDIESRYGSPDYWISKVAGFLLGKVTEADLFAAAASPDAKKESDQRCEAWYYAGMKKLLARDVASASDYFQKCLATEQKSCVEYKLASRELKELGP